jgi:hypothetical protein
MLFVFLSDPAADSDQLLFGSGPGNGRHKTTRSKSFLLARVYFVFVFDLASHNKLTWINWRVASGL